MWQVPRLEGVEPAHRMRERSPPSRDGPRRVDDRGRSACRPVRQPHGVEIAPREAAVVAQQVALVGRVAGEDIEGVEGPGLGRLLEEREEAPAEVGSFEERNALRGAPEPEGEPEG